jgi:cell division protease FtsH
MKPGLNKNNNQLKGPLGLVVGAAIFVLGLAMLSNGVVQEPEIVKLNLTEVYDAAESGNIEMIDFSGDYAVGKLKDGKQFQARVQQSTELIKTLREQGAKISVSDQVANNHLWSLLTFGLFIGFLLFMWFFMRQKGGGSGSSSGFFGMGKNKAKLIMPNSIKEDFSSYVGSKQVKEDLSDVVDYLKNPSKYEKLGAKITRGILLVGEPGTGKTLLARALAGEADCPFYSVSGSDFIEVFVGVGAARVRDLFVQARKNAPAIIFIDEIDAIGRQRGA